MFFIPFAQSTSAFTHDFIIFSPHRQDNEQYIDEQYGLKPSTRARMGTALIYFAMDGFKKGRQCRGKNVISMNHWLRWGRF
jgi:hypothetical protein